ncbi:MAG: glycosyltransferase family 4 protein [Blastocatellia bacterium]|nr:glycosyltransferase family 4 protein [Blastocatellia bacterium]MDW8257746.1 glycosyltransferase family 1 protein [Acidobacteriota bacterium]
MIPIRRWGPIPPECDAVWDPGLGMRPIPLLLRESSVPVIVTFHGARIFSPVYVSEAEWVIARLYHPWLKARLQRDRVWFREVVAAVIAPSQFAAREAAEVFEVSLEKVHAIPHGVDHELFRPDGDVALRERPYLLHIFGGNPMKNTERILAAYTRLSEALRPDLIVLSPGDWRILREFRIRGVKIIRRLLPQHELAKWYRGARALVAPSLRETFGLSILEAMACGCPVITSNRTGCAEVVGEAGLLVDPYSVEEIAEAMRRLIEDDALRERLRERGVERARMFDWNRSAAEHVRVFHRVLAGAASPRH